MYRHTSIMPPIILVSMVIMMCLATPDKISLGLAGHKNSEVFLLVLNWYIRLMSLSTALSIFCSVLSAPSILG